MKLRLTARELPAAVLTLALAAALARFPAFHSYANITAVCENAAVVGIMSCGECCVILAGGIDLSVGSTLAIAACTAAACMSRGMAPPIAAAAAAGSGMAAGCINGFFVSVRRLTPILTTLATLLIFRHGVSIATGARNYGPFPDRFTAFGAGWTPVLLLGAVVAVGTIFQFRLRTGRWMVAMGAGDTAARLAGISTGRVRTLTYVISGVCAAAAALIVMAYNNGAQSSIGQGYELDVIAACVVGGVKLTGGEGSVGGAALGALLISLLRNGLILTGRPAEDYGIFSGVLILGAALIELVRQRAARTGSVAAGVAH